MEKLKTLSRITLFLAVLIAGGLVSSGDLAAQFAGGGGGQPEVEHNRGIISDGNRSRLWIEVIVTDPKTNKTRANKASFTLPNDGGYYMLGKYIFHYYRIITDNEGNERQEKRCASFYYWTDGRKVGGGGIIDVPALD